METTKTKRKYMRSKDLKDVHLFFKKDLYNKISKEAELNDQTVSAFIRQTFRQRYAEGK